MYRRLWVVCSKLVSNRVEHRVSEVLICGAVKLIATALCDHIDDGAGCTSRVRSEVAGTDLYFLDRIDRRTYSDRSNCALVVVETVDLIVVQCVGLRVDGHCRTLAPVIWRIAGRECSRVAFSRSRCDLHELYVIAAIEMQALHLRGRKRTRELRGVRLERGGVSVDLHRFCCSPNVQACVNP